VVLTVTARIPLLSCGTDTAPHMFCQSFIFSVDHRLLIGWLHGAVVERWSLTGELSLSCTQCTADG